MQIIIVSAAQLVVHVRTSIHCGALINLGMVMTRSSQPTQKHSKKDFLRLHLKKLAVHKLTIAKV